MIGKPVSAEELQAVLDREAKRGGFRAAFEAELKAIKRGECLLYEVEEPVDKIASFGLAAFVGGIPGLRMVTEGLKTYVYRPK